MSQAIRPEAHTPKKEQRLIVLSTSMNAYEAITTANKQGVTLLPNPLVESIIHIINNNRCAYTGTIHLKQREITDPVTEERWILENLPRDMEKELNQRPRVYGFMNHGFEEVKDADGKVTHKPLIQINQDGNAYVVTFRNPEKNIKILALYVNERGWGIPDETFGIPVQPCSYKSENSHRIDIDNMFCLVANNAWYIKANIRPSDPLWVLGYDNMDDAPVRSQKKHPLDGELLTDLIQLSESEKLSLSRRHPVESKCDSDPVRTYYELERDAFWRKIAREEQDERDKERAKKREERAWRRFKENGPDIIIDPWDNA